MDLVDQFGGCFSDLFDVHAAFRGGHDEHRFGLTVDEKGEVVLVCDGAARLNVEVANELALGPGLDGHQHVAKDVRGVGADLLARKGDFHPAFHDEVTRVGSIQVAFATPTGVNLTLHGDDLRAEVVVCGQRLIG